MNDVVTKLELQPVAAQPASQIVSTDPMAMISNALAQGASAEMVDRLIAWGERMQAAAARRAFDEAIAAAKAQIRVVARNAKGHNDKRYADFAAYAREVDPVLASHGLSYRFRTTQDGAIRVTCVLSHRDGHSEENSLTGPSDTSGSKNAIQAIGSTLTYLQRYTLIQALGLASSNDDDGRAAGGSVEPPATITDAQAEALRKALAFKGRSEADFCRVMKRDALTDLEATRFDAALAWISKLPTPEATDA